MLTTANFFPAPVRACVVAGAACIVLSACSGGPAGPGTYSPNAIESQFMAEVALQRGEYIVAAQEYLRVAQRSDDPESAQRATEFAYDHGLDAHALAAAERWVQLEPDSRLAHGYAGRLYVRRNSLDRAFASLEISLGPVPDRLEFEYIVLAAELTDQAPAARAQQIFARFAQQSPENPAVLRAWASLAAQAGDLELAIELARQAAALAPAWQAARIMLANLLLAAGDRSSAFEQMAFAVETDSGLETQLELIRLLIQAGDGGEALERLVRLEERFPGQAELLRVRAEAHESVGDLESATDDYYTLLGNGVFTDDSLWELGRIAFDQEDYGAAAGYFQRIHGGPLELPARLARANSFHRMGDTDAAIRSLDDYAERYPKQRIETLGTRAQLLLEADQLESALATIELAIEYRPWSTGFWLTKGNLLEQLGRYSNAIAAFRQAYAYEPGDALVLNALGYTLANRTRNFEEAEAFIAQAIEKEPDNPAIMDSMGWVLFKQKRYPEAREWLERAYAQLDDPEIAAHLGELLWRQKDRAGAREVWNGALERFPDSEVLRETMRRLDE